MFGVITLPAVAQTDSVSKNVQLKEVVVAGDMAKREVDHIDCIPTPKQRKHAHSGFELIRNMMLSGVNVDTENGVITTPVGTATLYINGRKASVREITSLRPKDILHVEYCDMPTGKYANDKAVINYIVKTYTSGGYTQVDALQGVGYLKGDYNLTSKYSLGHYNVNLWAGSSVQNPKVYGETTTDYLLDNPIHKQEAAYDTDMKSIGRYVNASLSRRTERTTWMIRSGVEVSTRRDDVLNGSLIYMGYTVPLLFTNNVLEHDKTIKPTFSLYFNRNFKGEKSLECSLDGYYARNTYKRNSLEMEQFRLLLRQKGIFSMFEVEDVLFEANGAVTVLPTGKTSDSFLLVNNGEFVASGLKQSGRSQAWALRVIKKNGFNGPGELFCMEWTPGTGIYFVTYDGHVKRGVVEVDAHEIEPDNAQV